MWLSTSRGGVSAQAASIVFHRLAIFTAVITNINFTRPSCYSQGSLQRIDTIDPARCSFTKAYQIYAAGVATNRWVIQRWGLYPSQSVSSWTIHISLESRLLPRICYLPVFFPNNRMRFSHKRKSHATELKSCSSACHVTTVCPDCDRL